MKFTNAEGNPFVKAFIYIQANRDEWDVKICQSTTMLKQRDLENRKRL